MDGGYATTSAINGNGNGSAIHDEPTTPSAPATTFDPAVFQTYLTSLLPPVLGASPTELETLFDSDFNEQVTRFAGEGGDVIYVVKRREEVEGACYTCIWASAVTLTDEPFR